MMNTHNLLFEFKTHIKLIIHLGLLFIISTLAGQTWETYTTANSGTPADVVLSLAVDDQGIKWIGTNSGLARFDGNIWTTYTTTTSGLPSNNVRCIGISDTGDIWMGTNGGLAVYDGFSQGQNPDGSWQGWTVYDMNNSGLPRNVVESLAIDSFGVIWAGTLGGGGLASFNGVSWQVYNTSNSDIPNNFIYALEITGDDLLWVGTNFGIARFDLIEWTAYNTNNSELPDNGIRSLALDLNERVYIGTENGGLATLLGNSWTIYNQFNSPLPENHISAILVKDSGIAWIGTANSGLLRKNNTVWTLYNPITSGIPGNTVSALILDHDLLKWIGTGQGLASYDFISVTGIEVEPGIIITQTGETHQLTATINPDNATDQEYHWYSEDVDLAIVDEDGLVTTLNTGTVFIFAQTNDGAYISSCLIHITGTVELPEFSPPGGEYTVPVSVSISSETEDALIRYTLDGSEPNEESPLYTDPIAIDTTTIISARAYKEHWVPSELAVAEYIITTSVDEGTIAIQDRVTCLVFPNPVYESSRRRNSGNLVFQIRLPAMTDTKLVIYDIRGRRVREYGRANQPAGDHFFSMQLNDMNGNRLSAGIYFYRLQTEVETVRGRFTIIR